MDNTSSIRHPRYMLRAIGDWNRLRILLLLRNHEMSLNDIRTILSWNNQDVRRHLTYLRTVSLVSVKKMGRNTCYWLPLGTGSLLEKVMTSLANCFYDDQQIQADAAKFASLSSRGKCCSVIADGVGKRRGKHQTESQITDP